MILVDRLLVGGLRFVLDKVARAVESEMNDEGSLKEDLLAAQMRLELGEMSAEEFAEVERDLLARLREIRERETAEASGAMQITGIDVSVADDVEDQSPDGPRGR